MPVEPELPANVVPWRPYADRAVLLIHDMQRYFLKFFPEGEPVTTLVENIRRIRSAAAALGVPVVYTAQRGMTAEERGLLRDFWGPGMDSDPASTQITPELAPGDDDVVFAKWRYSAFYRSDLESLIRRSGRDQLIVCGIYAHVGCLMTACDAFTRDIQPFLVADAVADFNADYHRLALEYAASRCAATTSTTALLEGMRAGAAGANEPAVLSR
jgi:bifunctional isochorismate lyase/aryl carrier protein